MSRVIDLTFPQPEIALITLQDKTSKNTFSPSFVSEIKEAFADIKANPLVKVVITQGYGNYYACGATQEFMNECVQGKKNFTELDFFDLPLLCELPTIAAVQGHAIGGGLSFACLHDFIFMSSSAVYSANFMKYGITPDMGATYTVPKRFGANCGHQLLFTAKQYTQEELEALQCLLPFYRKEEVLEKALELARNISDCTVTSIKLLKKSLSFETRQALPGVIENELRMQSKTGTTKEVFLRIQEKYKE